MSTYFPSVRRRPTRNEDREGQNKVSLPVQTLFYALILILAQQSAPASTSSHANLLRNAGWQQQRTGHISLISALPSFRCSSESCSTPCWQDFARKVADQSLWRCEGGEVILVRGHDASSSKGHGQQRLRGGSAWDWRAENTFTAPFPDWSLTAHSAASRVLSLRRLRGGSMWDQSSKKASKVILAEKELLSGKKARMDDHEDVFQRSSVPGASVDPQLADVSQLEEELYDAASAGRVDAIESCVERGARVNVGDGHLNRTGELSQEFLGTEGCLCEYSMA